MKIAFIGCSGTGKTTLAQYVAEHYQIPLNPMGARRVAEDLGFIDERGKPNPYLVDKANARVYRQYADPDQLYDHPENPSENLKAAKMALEIGVFAGEENCRALFQKRVQDEKIAWEEAHPDGFVTDRTTLDDLSYLVLHQLEAITESFWDRAFEHAATYDIIFFTPMAVFWDLGGDSARVGDTAYHRAHESVLQGMLLKLANSRAERRTEIPLLAPGLTDRHALVHRYILQYIHNRLAGTSK